MRINFSEGVQYLSKISYIECSWVIIRIIYASAFFISEIRTGNIVSTWEELGRGGSWEEERVGEGGGKGGGVSWEGRRRELGREEGVGKGREGSWEGEEKGKNGGCLRWKERWTRKRMKT